MTLTRDGWIDGRPYAVHPQRGEPQAYVCLGCEADFEPDPAVFEAHRCHDYKPPPEPKRVEATEAAIEAAREQGVTLAALEGSGKDGRIIKSDVTSATKE